MLMILMPLDFNLVENWVRYDELNFWCALCFGSICSCYEVLAWINHRSMFYAMRAFDPSHFCLILEFWWWMFMMPRRKTTGEDDRKLLFRSSGSGARACTVRAYDIQFHGSKPGCAFLQLKVYSGALMLPPTHLFESQRYAYSQFIFI